MSSAGVILVVLVGGSVVALIVYLAKLAAKRERERLAALNAWGAANGFSFYKTDPFDLDARYRGMGQIGRGHDRYAYEVLQRSEPVWAFIFRYHFVTTETRTVHHSDSNGRSYTTTETYEQTHHHAYLVIELQAAFPMLVIRPEHWGDKLAGFLGFDDIDFESEQFSSRYFVKSADRQFAYAIIHPQMMEWLMDKRFVGQLQEGRFVIDITGVKFEPSAIADVWSQAVGFINRIPPFVWQDYGKVPQVQLPQPTAPVATTAAAAGVGG
jgi:hypothetical protein